MISFFNFKKYSSELITLSLPIIMGNIGHMLIGAGDVFVAGRHSVDTLASISIANAIITCVIIFGIGILSSISPVLSNYRGEKKEPQKYFTDTILFSLIVSSVITVFVLFCNLFIDKIGFSVDLLPDIKDYIFISAFSTFGAFLHFSLKEFLQSFEDVFFANFISIIAIFVNLGLNFVFVFGMFGFLEFGVKGLAIASFIVRYMLGFALFFYCLKIIKPEFSLKNGYFKQLVKVGLPIACALIIEFLALNIATIILGRISSLYAACQNIMIVLSSATFMIPLAVSNAIAVKVGFANGEKNYLNLRNYSITGTLICIIFMSLCAFMFIAFPKFFIQIFSDNIQILKICIPALIVVGIFEIFDGIQVAFSGILKGLKKTKIVFFSNIFAYWLFAIPLGFYLAVNQKMFLTGFWIGFAAALFMLSFVLIIILKKIFKSQKNNFLQN